MSDIYLLATLGILVLSIFVDIFRVNQFRKYIQQNKIILAEMVKKNSESRDIMIQLKKIEEINETINNTDI